MRNIFSLQVFRILVIMGLPLCFTAGMAQMVSVKVMTYNIRYANAGDTPNAWGERKEKVFALISESDPDVFGLQEALKEQITDMEKAFPGYKRVGVGRDDGKEAGEYSPLFYNAGKYKLKESGVFWLSQTPTLPGSRGWDAACNRVVTWVQLKDKASGLPFFVFCTHFDHMGEVARRNSARLLLHAVDSLAGTMPVVVLGDFNALPESEPYRIITDTSNPLHLTDAHTLCENPRGPAYTYTGFEVGGIEGERIDYIFLKGETAVTSYGVDPANNGTYYPSDHLPVSVGLRLY
jgi:endonuclease/exonuclease/phosphatase family metal-dependent hydrolase